MASETQNLSRLSPNVVVGDPDGTCLSHRDHHRPNAIRCTLYAVLNMQNKPNFPKSQMNVKTYNTTDYENIANWTVRKNKPNSKPISSKPKMNANVYVIEDYENETTFRPQKNKPNSNPISKQLVGSRPRWAESAKMAQQIDVLKHQNTILKKSNFLYPNRLNSLNQHNPPTGTSFAYLEYMR